METKAQIKTACVLANAIDVASKILAAIDGVDINSGGNRHIVDDVAVVLNAKIEGGANHLMLRAGGNNAA